MAAGMTSGSATDAFSVTGGWPSVFAMHVGPDFPGPPVTGKAVTVRVMDFYLHHEGLIRENWVPLDVLVLLRQARVFRTPLDVTLHAPRKCSDTERFPRRLPHFASFAPVRGTTACFLRRPATGGLIRAVMPVQARYRLST